MLRSEPASVAVIGAGVAGCALTAQLRRLGFRGALSIWETGRGAGGRAGSRHTRSDGRLVIDHGAPLLNITGAPPPQLLEPLLNGGWISSWQGPVAMLEGESRLNIGRPDALGLGQLFRGRGGMDQLCRGLLHLESVSGVDQHYRTLVRTLAWSRSEGWQLFSSDGTRLVAAEWLVLSSTLLAHPRSQLIFGWADVPLARVAADLGDLQLDHALTSIAGIRFEARSNLLLVFERQAALPWRALPFSLVSFDAAAQQRWGLSRLSIQPLPDGRCAVVVHSSAAFAADHLDVYGSRSAVAQMLKLPPDQGREEQVIQAMVDSLRQCLAAWISGVDFEAASPQLMRWGAAFPVAPGLPSALMLCPHSRIGFCGDYLAGMGFGRVEGALRSAECLAALLVQSE
jgi:hypothetical protein